MVYVEVLEDLGGGFKYMFYFHPDLWGRFKPSLDLRRFFSIRVVSQPPTGRDAQPSEEKFHKSQLMFRWIHQHDNSTCHMN